MNSRTTTVPACHNANNTTPGETESETVIIYPATIKWIPPSNSKPCADSKVGHVEDIKNNTRINSRLWRLLEFSIPPLLKRNYHCANISELMKLDKVDGYQSIAAWFVCYCEAFGLQHLSSIQFKHYRKIRDLSEKNQQLELTYEEYKGSEVEKDGRIWRSEVDKVILRLQGTLGLSSSPKLADEAKKPEEILLEPCVIIQLPWHTVLFHQWLIAALAQVYLFEKESLELRHWPLPVEIEPCAREILLLIRQLKERVMLGFYILSKQVNIYPEIDTKHPGWILDQVVLPSLATLQFLTSGKADEVLRSIKKTAWSKCEGQEELEKRVFVPKESYEVYPELKYLFDRIHISIVCWKEFLADAPFVMTELEGCEVDGNIVEIFQNINSDDISSYPPLILEDKIQLTEEEKLMVVNDGKILINPIDRITNTIYGTKQIINAKIISADMLDLLVNMIDNDDTRILAEDENLFAVDSHSYLQLVIIHTLLYHKTYNLLNHADKEKGIISRIMNLQYEIIEREQFIKLAFSLALLLDITPVVPSLDKSTPVGPKTISKALQKVCTLRETQNRDWLWSQFPEEWRKPVKLDEKLITHTTKFPEISKELEDRIGRIIFNTAQKCFDIYENGGDIFEHWTTVQYILPCYVASYHALMSKDILKRTLNNNIKLLHTIFKFYEEAFEAWHTEIIPRKTPVDPNNDTAPISHIQTDELYQTISYYNNMSNIILSGIIGQREPVCPDVHRFHNLHVGLIEFLYTNNGGEDNEVIYYNLKSWAYKSVTIFKDLFENANKALDIPLPGYLVEPKVVGDIYYISSLMMSLENVFLKSVINIGDRFIDYDMNVVTIITDTRNKVFLMRIKLITTIVERTEEEPPFQFVLHVMKLELRKMYNCMKEFKMCLGPSTLQYLEDLPDNPPELKLVAMHYLNSDFESLENILSYLLLDPQANLSFQESMEQIFSNFLLDSQRNPINTKGKAKRRPNKKVEKQVASTSKPVPPKKCRNCPRTEEKRGTFLTCEKCKEQKYPDVNFYCSKSCKYAWWKAEHMAEHLEFELGLSDFSHLKLDDKDKQSQ